ncbi:VCBS repeat-containing protein [Streptomyces sp. NBC_01511]|uniref:FG-GAP repeat domain-containing protein n=1 Tax=Streptomyces sp. NBC_01511 TaxID=2903889 RepID=UPI00386D4607
MKIVSGDYTGDGTDDVAAAYQYDDGIKLWTWIGKGNGTFSEPVSSWAGSWTLDRMTLHSGDFNGDGRDDLGVWYRYTDSTKLWTFTSDVGGRFSAPFSSWSTTTWAVNRSKFTTGDFNGDGRDDFATWYDFADGHDIVHAFAGNANGTVKSPTVLWNAAADRFWRSETKIVAGGLRRRRAGRPGGHVPVQR